MDTPTRRRHPLFVYLLLAGVLLGSGVAFAGAGLVWNVRTMDYPGATVVSQHTRLGIRSGLFLRHDASYRSSDTFPVVYNWYSTGFNLGPESRAHGPCILMEDTRPWFLLRRHMSVMVCDTPSGRMIFVERTLTFH